ncbi:MAG TPA: phosphatidate cytidylyltransferase [Thermoleophilaceae bacterium]|nr:phosphatidate cytidylyltransferase [Thermoleophilaceae bacterium]
MSPPDRPDRDTRSAGFHRYEIDRRYRDLDAALDPDRGRRRERTPRTRREADRQRALRAAEERYGGAAAGGGGETTAEVGAKAEDRVRRQASENRRRTERRERGTAVRILHALPMIAFAILIVALGGAWFALGLLALGVIAMHELYGMMRRVRPIDVAGFVGLAGLLLAALVGGREAMLAVLVATLPVTFAFAVARPSREHVAWGIAATLFGVMWIGLALGHAVLVRELAHGGGLVLDILIGTFVGDTCAYFGGRAWGRRPLAPSISPNKTVVGLIAGIAGGTFAFWGFAIAYQDFLPGAEALLIGFCVAVAAPVGDLFESLVKRDLDAKDTGSFFGSHGGVLDRLDGALFAAVVGYYAALAVL